MPSNDFYSQQKEFSEFLKFLSDNNLLNEVIVAGSWAEYIYAQSGLLKGFDGNLRTLDVDFLVKNMRLPRSPVSLISLAKTAGYDVQQDTLYETTKIVTPNRLEIEFLINQMGRGDKPVLRTNLGVNAQALRHMDISLHNTVTVDFLTMSVTVPKPEAYVIHKMVINEKRTPEKKEKDARAVFRLAPYLDRETYQNIYDGLYRKEQKAVDAFIEQNGDLFKPGLSELVTQAEAIAIAKKYSSVEKKKEEEPPIEKGNVNPRRDVL